MPDRSTSPPAPKVERVTTPNVLCRLCGQLARRTEVSTVRAWGRMDCPGGLHYLASAATLARLESRWQAGAEAELKALAERVAASAAKGLVTWISAEGDHGFVVVATPPGTIPPDLAAAPG